MARLHASAREVTASAAPSSIAALRHWAVDRGRSVGASTGALAAVELAASEVVTNAVVHTATTVDVTMRFHVDGGVMHFEVQDAEPAPPRLRARDDGEPGGFGLHIVEALSERWGCRPVEAGGKVVWFTISLVGPG
jgi:anti-sigma regulatory factor (Ser/Thr protein kinase)